MLDYQEDLYAVLGVEEASPPEDIRKAYLKLAKKLHPDRFPNDPEKRAEAQSEFSKVTRAHDVLSDAKQREEYNALRGLAKSRSGLGVDAAAETAAATTATATEQKVENKDSWATKHNDRAMDLLRRKKYADAETAIKEAIRLCPQTAAYHATLAEIHLARGWKTLATTAVQTALKLDPKNHEAKNVELKLKAAGPPVKSGNGGSGGEKKGFLDQLKEMLNKKI